MCAERSQPFCQPNKRGMASWKKSLVVAPMRLRRPKLVRSNSTGLEVGSDKVILPQVRCTCVPAVFLRCVFSRSFFCGQSALQELSRIPSVQYPMFFELVNPGTNTRSYAGVLEVRCWWLWLW